MPAISHGCNNQFSGQGEVDNQHIWTEKRKKVWNREKNYRKISAGFSCQLIFLYLPFPISFISLLFFCKTYSSFICKLADPRSSLGSSSPIQGTCVQLQRLSSILPGTHSNIINCGVFNISFSLTTLLQIYSSNTVKSTHIWIIT